MQRSVAASQEAPIAGLAGGRSPVAADGETHLYNVQPTRRDPLLHALKDRARLSPLAFAMAMLGFNSLQAFIDLVLLQISHELYFNIHSAASRTYYIIGYVVMPIAAYLMMRFYRRAETVFERIHTSGVVSEPLPVYNAFLRKLDRRYNSVLLHLVVLLLSSAQVIIAISLNATGDYTWRGLHTAFRVVSDGLFVIVPRYILLLFVVKAIITAVAVRRVFRWPIKVHLMHADGVGGMRPVADVCATLVKFCILASITNVAITYVWGEFRFTFGSAFGLLLAFSPLVFLWVLYGAHVAMARARHEWLTQLDAQARPLVDDLQTALQRRQVPPAMADELLRLDQLRGLVGKMPTWPFDHQTAVQLGLSVLLPVVLILLQVVLEKAVR